jgi:hypothetical protein
MKDKTYQIVLVIGTSIFSSMLTLLVGMIFVLFYIIQPFQKEAVDRGFATWEVTDNATGSTKFTWNEFAQALHPDNPNNFFEEIEAPLPKK